MPIQCRLVDPAELQAQGEQLKPGDMYFMPSYLNERTADYYVDHFFSPEYKADWLGKRPPIHVVLPDGRHWCADQISADGVQGWHVTGDAPTITVRPSIVSDGYHGWLTDGIFSDDLEGRSFSNESDRRVT